VEQSRSRPRDCPCRFTRLQSLESSAQGRVNVDCTRRRRQAETDSSRCRAAAINLSCRDGGNQVESGALFSATGSRPAFRRVGTSLNVGGWTFVV
jgi:hypothetical protein